MPFKPTRNHARTGMYATTEVIGNPVDMANARQTIRENRKRRAKLMVEAIQPSKQKLAAWYAWRRKNGWNKVVVGNRIGYVHPRRFSLYPGNQVQVEFPNGELVWTIFQG